MDSSVPQDQPFGQKSAGESSLLNDTKIPIPRQRATILWDRSLEDVIEDDNDEMEEQHNMSREEAVQKHEEYEVIMGEERYRVCAKTTLRTSVVWSLKARYSSCGFPHLSLFSFFWSPLFYLNPVLRIKSGITHNFVPVMGKSLKYV